jgi:hypothetical protein
MIELTINELSTGYVPINFYDDDGLPVIPASGTYRIDDEYSGEPIVEWTGFIPTSATYIIELPTTATVIIDRMNMTEKRNVTVIFLYGTGKQGTAYNLFIVQQIPNILVVDEVVP